MRDLGPVDTGCVSRETSTLRLPYVPPWVLDFVFEANAARLRRVTPIMLGDELARGAIRREEACPFGFDPHQTLLRPRTPRVFGFHDVTFGTGFNAMRHWNTRIVLPE